MGIIFTMPLPQMLATTMTAMASRARGQHVEALDTAVPARDRPMRIIMGPVTMGGKKRMTRWGPTTLKSRARIRYSRPATTMPPRA